MFPGFSFLCRLVAAVLAALPAAATPPKPPLSRLSVVVLTYIFVPTFVAASYREFKFTNHDLCTSVSYFLRYMGNFFSYSFDNIRFSAKRKICLSSYYIQFSTNIKTCFNLIIVQFISTESGL